MHTFRFKISRDVSLPVAPDDRFLLLDYSSIAACAAATLAIGTLNGEQLT